MKCNTRKSRQTLTQFILKTVNELEGPTTAANILRTVLGAFPNADQNSVRAILTMAAKIGKISKEVLPNTNKSHVHRVLYGPLHQESTQKPSVKPALSEQPFTIMGFNGSDALKALSALYPEKTKIQIIDEALLRFHRDTIMSELNPEKAKEKVEPSHDISIDNDQGEVHIHVHLHGIN